MKKILNEFLKKENTTLLKANVIRFKTFIEQEYPEINKKEAYDFFFALQNEKKTKAKTYENTHTRKTIRFSTKEYEKISEQLEKADVKNFSQWAKSVLLKQNYKSPIEQKKVIEMSKIGTDLSEIARYINNNGIKNTPMAIDILKKLVLIEQELKNL